MLRSEEKVLSSRKSLMKIQPLRRENVFGSYLQRKNFIKSFVFQGFFGEFHPKASNDGIEVISSITSIISTG